MDVIIIIIRTGSPASSTSDPHVESSVYLPARHEVDERLRPSYENGRNMVFERS